MASASIETPEFRALRLAYLEHRAWVEAIEDRLCATDAGMAFVYRVKAVGRCGR